MGIKRLGRVALVFSILTGLLVVDGSAAIAQDAPPGEAQECAEGELISRRTRDSKTVLLSDCGYTTTFEPNLHFEAEPGRWEEVDLRFRTEGGAHVADRNNTIVRVSGARLDVTDRANGQGIRWLLPNPASVRGHRARFESDGLAWEYTVTGLGVKLAATVSGSRGPETYRFPYQLLGASRELQVGGGGLLQGDGFQVPRAFALGADGHTYPAGAWRLLEGNRVAFDFNDSQLPGSAFPYILDPTTTFNPSQPGDEGEVSRTGPSYPPASCGGWSDTSSTVTTQRSVNAKSDYTTTNGFMSWDTSSLPDNASVTSANAKFYASNKDDGDSRSLTADWYAAWAIDCNDFNDTAQTTAIGGMPLADISTASDTIVGLSGSAAGVSRTGRTGLRTHISGGQPTTPNSLAIWQLGNGSNMPNPQLNVTYTTGNTPPVISFDVSPTTGDRSTVFNASLAGTTDPENDPISYRIDWGEGTISHSQTSNHSYDTAGTYTVSGQACDSAGACSSANRTVTVEFSNDPPTAQLTVSPTTGDLRTTFSATVTGSDPNGDSLSYDIDWGDGTSSAGQGGTHTYADPGRYIVAGIVTDAYGASGSATQEVTVCAVYEQGQCVEGPPREDPPSVNPPAQVSQPVANVIRNAPEVKGLAPSESNEVMILDANILQAYALDNDNYRPTCTLGADEVCDAPGRMTRFIQRIVTLVDKTGGDGMNNVAPDVLLLQEVRLAHAQTVARRLTNKLGFRYIALIGSENPQVADTTEVDDWCLRHPEDPQKCKDDIKIKADSAIIYNEAVLTPTTTGYLDSKYDPDERCDMIAGQDIDADEDGDLDCRWAKWKRNYFAGFDEHRVNRPGRLTGYSFAVASSHFVTLSHFKDDDQDPEDNLRHEEKKNLWSGEVADKLALEYPLFDSHFIGGDLNIHRCRNKAPAAAGDYPIGAAACETRAWFANLTGKSYVDAILQEHQDDDGSGDRIVEQYRDGKDGNTQKYRPKRIDYLFARSATIRRSSGDLTCGEVATGRIDRNCRDVRNPEFYSDHRLLWTLVRDAT